MNPPQEDAGLLVKFTRPVHRRCLAANGASGFQPSRGSG